MEIYIIIVRSSGRIIAAYRDIRIANIMMENMQKEFQQECNHLCADLYKIERTYLY